MRYIEATQFGGPEVLKLTDSPLPTVPSGSVLVEVKAAGVNYLDLVARTGFYPAISKVPFVPGFEVAGVVKEVGEGVESLRPGDRVAAITLNGGGYASHIVIPASIAIPLPDGLDFSVATAVLVQGLTAYMLIEETQVKQDDFVLISAAAGGVGLLAVQIAKMKGAKVIGLASKSKHSVVTASGAQYVFDYHNPGWTDSVMETTGGRGVEVYLDSMGNLGGESFAVLSNKARWIVFGIRSGVGDALSVEHLWTMIERNISLRGFNLEGSFQHIPHALGDLLTWVSEGKLKVDVTNHPLEQAASVHRLFENRETTGKIILTP